jgi:hypothetical protein
MNRLGQDNGRYPVYVAGTITTKHKILLVVNNSARADTRARK